MKLKRVFLGLFVLTFVMFLFACQLGAQPHTITFETNGGTAVAAIEAKAGDAITKPADPTKENCTFDGWFKDSELKEAYTFPATMPDEDVKLYAKWLDVIYKITFESNGGSAVAEIKAKAGDAITKPANPTKANSVFEGWFKDSALKEAYTFPTKMPAGDVKLYAKWSDMEYTITFDTDGGSEVAQIKAKAGEALTKPANPTKENLTFGGWYSDIDLTEKYEFPAKMPANNVELYAKWVVTLTFDSKGGPAVDPIVGDAGRPFVMPNDPVRDGYVFVGWFTDEAFTKQLTFVMPRANTTAYAKWQVFETGSAVTVPMKFSDNDGCFVLEETTDGLKVTATSGKGEWSYIASVIPCSVKKNNTVVVELVGTAGAKVTLKVEGGNAEGATETTVEMTGEAQKVIWSDDAAKFSSVGGAKFLVFLNGGTAGASETPEYVEIKSVKLYRTVDATDTQKAAIYFVMNGADEVEEIYDVPGTVVAKPADPERSGFVFGGWFADAAFTTPYTFDKIPAEGAMVFAKWDKAKELKPDVVLDLSEPVIDNADAYEIKFEQESLVFKKTAAGEEWSWFGLEFPEGADLGGFDHLLVSFKGPKDQKLLLKINDKVEKWITCTGAEESLDLPFDHVFDMTKKAMVIFANGGVAGESGEFQITYLAFANHQTIFDLMKGTIECEETQPTTLVKNEDGTLTLKKAPKDGCEWDCAKINVEGNLLDCNVLYAVLKGTAGERVLLKIFDKQEVFVDLTGEMQLLYVPITATEVGKYSLVLFANPNANGTGNPITIYSAMYLALVAEEHEEEPIDEDLMMADVKPLETTLDAHYVLTLTKTDTTDGSHWSCVAGTLIKPDYTGLSKLLVTVKGTAGEKIKFKVNDKKEYDVECTGEVQNVEFDLPADFTFDELKAAIIIFANAGEAGTSHPFEITKLALTGESNEINLLTCLFYALDADMYEVDKKFVMSKETTGGEWAAIVVQKTGDFSEYYGIKYAIKGTAGQKVLFKVNDTNAGETWLTLTGELQEGYITKIPAEYNPDKSVLVLFPDAGLAGTGNVIEIYELTFLVEEPPIPEADLTLDFMDGTVGSPYNSTDWTREKYGNSGWENMTGQMNCREKDGVRVVNVVAGYSMTYKYTYNKGGESLGLANKLTVKVGNYFTPNQVIPMKLILIDKDGNNIYLVGTKDAFVDFPVTTGLVDKKFIFDETEIVSIQIVTKSTYNGAQYLYFGDVNLTYAEIIDDVDLMTAPLNPLHDSITTNYALTLTKTDTTDNSHWSCVVGALDKPNYEGLTKLVATVKGTAGEKLLLKLNDQNAGEKMVECTGEVQEVEFDIPANFEFDASKNAIVIFANAGEAGTSHPFEITKLALTGEGKSVDLLTASFRALDPTFYTVEKKLVMKKAETGTGYEAIVLQMTGDFSKHYGLKYSIKGTAGQKVLFKIDDVNAGETWLDLTGEVQTGVITKIPAEYDATKSVLVLFPDAGVAGTGNAIEIYELTFLGEEPQA